MLRKFTHAFHVPGALTANLNIRFKAPSNCSLVHVSAVASNASDATLDVGTSADTDGFIAAMDFGDSNVPAEYAIADFDGDLLTDAGKEPARIADGDVVVLVVDFDGASGTAAQNATIVLTFVEG